MDKLSVGQLKYTEWLPSESSRRIPMAECLMTTDICTELMAFTVSPPERDLLVEALKRALYKLAKDKKTERERIRLSAPPHRVRKVRIGDE